MYKIKMVESKFAKINNRWVATCDFKREIDMRTYNNIIGAKTFMINLGGYERHEKSYTCNGYIVTHINSLSPDRQNKTVYEFDFINMNGGTN